MNELKEALRMVVWEDWLRINEGLVHEVYREWDNEGEGSFAFYFLKTLAEKWGEYASQN